MSVEVEENTEVQDPATTLMRAVVKVRDADGKLWKEVGEVISVSSTGAGFYMKRECQTGCLVSVMIPVEPHLRYYDHEKELYRVWGLVQHCHRITSDDSGYHVGVAFIGRESPASYSDDPMQSYRICGMNEDGLWKVKEAAKEFKPRKDARYYAAIDHYLAVVDAEKTSLRGERSVTENISKHGAAVVSNLELNVGDRVKFISEQYDFSGLAVVCNSRKTTSGKTRLSLQFVGADFPIQRVSAKAMKPKEEPVAA